MMMRRKRCLTSCQDKCRTSCSLTLFSTSLCITSDPFSKLRKHRSPPTADMVTLKDLSASKNSTLGQMPSIET